MGNGLMNSAEIYDKNGNLVDILTARTHLGAAFSRGDLFTTYIFVGEDSIIDKVAIEVESAGLRFEYMTATTYAANMDAYGRFGIWITNDGDATSATIKNVTYLDNSDDSFEYTTVLGKSATENAALYAHYDFSDATSISDLPGVVLDGANADAVLRDGALYLETDGALSERIYHNDTAFILPRTYLPDGGNYTLELVLDGNSYANYTFMYWTNDDYSDDNVALTEYFNFLTYYKEDIKGNADKLAANKGVVNAVGNSGGADFPADMRNNRKNNEIRIQLIVENNIFAYAYVSIVTEEGVLSAHYTQTGNKDTANRDFAIMCRTDAGYGGSVGIKSITILDNAYCDLDTTDYSAPAESVEDIVAATALTAGATSYNSAAQGIRFTTAIDADDFQTLTDLCDEGKVDKIEFGTLITTEAWADAAGAVTFAALDTAVGESGKTAYVAVMATVGDFYDGLNTFAGSIGNAKAERTYVAVGFAKVTIGEDVIYVYSAATTAALASVQG